MDPTREAGHLADVFEENFEKRRRAVEEWNQGLEDGTFVPSRWTRLKWKAAARAGWGREDGRREVGLCLVRLLSPWAPFPAAEARGATAHGESSAGPLGHVLLALLERWRLQDCQRCCADDVAARLA